MGTKVYNHVLLSCIEAFNTSNEKSLMKRTNYRSSVKYQTTAGPVGFSYFFLFFSVVSAHMKNCNLSWALIGHCQLMMLLLLSSQIGCRILLSVFRADLWDLVWITLNIVVFNFKVPWGSIWTLTFWNDVTCCQVAENGKKIIWKAFFFLCVSS